MEPKQDPPIKPITTETPPITIKALAFLLKI
jgi:hypothetical protein